MTARLPLDAEDVARAFHEAYERLAPAHGYQTRKASAVSWEDVPAANKSLMIEVARTALLPLIDAEHVEARALLANILKAWDAWQWPLVAALPPDFDAGAFYAAIAAAREWEARP